MQELLEQLVGYLRGMWQRRWFALAVAWIGAIIGAVYVYRLPDQFQASARVWVDTQSMLRPLMRGMALTPDPSQQIAILSRQLRSRPNMEKVIRKADLDTARGVPAEQLIDEVTAGLRINRAGGDNLYTIAFNSSDGRKARDVVQAAVTLFIEQSLGERGADADSARRFLDQQIKEYEARMDEIANRVQAFRLKHMGVIGTSGNTYVSQIAALTEKIKDANVQLRVAEQTREGIQRQLEEHLAGETPAAPVEAPPGAVPELDGRIDTLKRQLDELLRKYTELHPDVRQANRILALLTEERNRVLEARRIAALGQPSAVAMRGDPVAQQLKVALNEAEAHVTQIRAVLAESQSSHAQLKAAAEMLPGIQAELAQFERDYALEKRQYDALVRRRETVSMSDKVEDAGLAEFRIIDPPRVSPGPVGPNRLLLLAGIFGASLAAGLAVSFLVSQVRPTFHEGRALREILGRPLLGMVSVLPSPEFLQQRRRAALLFAGGMGMLLVTYGATLAPAYLGIRVF